MRLPDHLLKSLQQRQADQALRRLPEPLSGIDFSSNDYLGFARSADLYDKALAWLAHRNLKVNGSTGSRLISGNHSAVVEVEGQLAEFHQADAALIFNSGYDANLGVFSSLPQRNDVILYDELCHASIRDGIRLSAAKSYKFRHNDTEHLKSLLEQYQGNTIFVATESVFSMDGDTPPMAEMVSVCRQSGAYLIVDEAHALGVFGEKGQGVLQSQNLHHEVFARVMTFGKGLGCHGAVVLGSTQLKQYLVNFARSFIYTTALSPHALAAISIAYTELENPVHRQMLQERISHFNQEKMRLGIKPIFVYGKSAIQSAILPGNDTVSRIASQLQDEGFAVKAILSPTVPQGLERLRFCLHTYNSANEITAVLSRLATFV
jgi:8-amino-7-oxononanoate synthase